MLVQGPRLKLNDLRRLLRRKFMVLENNIESKTNIQAAHYQLKRPAEDISWKRCWKEGLSFKKKRKEKEEIINMKMLTFVKKGKMDIMKSSIITVSFLAADKYIICGDELRKCLTWTVKQRICIDTFSSVSFVSPTLWVAAICFRIITHSFPQWKKNKKRFKWIQQKRELI